MNKINIDIEHIVSDVDRNIFGGVYRLGLANDPDEHQYTNDSS